MISGGFISGGLISGGFISCTFYFGGYIYGGLFESLGVLSGVFVCFLGWLIVGCFFVVQLLVPVAR